LRVELVRVTDVYDEFSGGVFTPQAIRDFLTYAYANWQPPAPTYVLLVGDANMDYLDRFGTGSLNYVPTYVFDARDLGQTANDTWFACVDGADPLPDLLLGRLSARSRADVQAMVSKIVAYETDLAPGGWVTRTLFVADDDLTTFETAAERWIGQLPTSHAVQRVYASGYPPGNAQTDIVSAINEGVSLVTYIGHGNQDRWGTWGDNQRLLDTAAVGQLNNADRLPFVATATCLNGFFPNPLVDYSIAEELARKANGGAVGVWAPTALGWPWEHDILFGEMLDELFTADTPTLGGITTQAKLDAYGKGVSQELIETFTLFGDPALRVKTGPGYQVYLPLALRVSAGQ
jgi:hypothetical protein